MFYVGIQEGRGSIYGQRALHVTTVLAWLWSKRAMLWFGGHCMLVFVELFDDIPRHQNIQSMVVLISIELDATVEVAFPIFDEFVLFLEAFYQMVDILFVDVFHTKGVDHQGEQYVLCCVYPQSWSLFAFSVSVRRESFAQQLVC